MKHSQILPKLAMMIAICVTAEDSIAQGRFLFSNTGANGGAIAIINGPDPNDPYRQQFGNTPEGRPPGTQTYAGTPLEGNGFSVEAWYSLTPATDTSALYSGASAVPMCLDTFSTGLGAGFFFGITANMTEWVYNPELDDTGVYLQIRAWDNMAGEFESWESAWNAAQIGNENAVGWSRVFWQPLAFAVRPDPGLFNFESFNIFIVPEPGTVWLSVLGGLALLMAYCRRRQG